MRPSYKYPPKPIDRPDNISVLLPTRGRPQGLVKVFENFRETVENKSLFDVWLYVDDDDAVTLDYINSGKWKSYDYAINWHIAKSTSSMGEMLNTLWQECKSNPGIYFPFVDDYLVGTQHWDNILRERFSKHADRLLLGFMPDPTTKPHQVTLPIPSAEWLNTLGYFITNRFYYWFDDSWLDDIATMVNRKVLLPISLIVPGGKGKTPRMQNLRFWNSYFTTTLIHRFNDAIRIMEKISILNPANSYTAQLEIAFQEAAVIAYKRNKITDAESDSVEKALRDFSKSPTLLQQLGYISSELRAIYDLIEIITDNALETSDSWAMAIRETLQKSVISLPEHTGLFESVRNTLTQSFAEQNSIPSWIHLQRMDFILFPSSIDQELYFLIQYILYLHQSIRSILVIGAGDGTGAVDAVCTAMNAEAFLYCIEPNNCNFSILQKCYGEIANCKHGYSSDVSSIISEKQIELFYNYISSIMNYYPIEQILEWRSNEINSRNKCTLNQNCINAIKDEISINCFDMAILDGSFFTGEADLQAIYGSQFIILNHIRSIKNYANYKRLLVDNNYILVDVNTTARCGYAFFQNTEDESHPIKP